VVRPGGRLSIDAGGHGNNAEFLKAVDGGEAERERIWNFADIPETRRRLRDAGFQDVAVRLVADEVHMPERAQLEAFVATVMLSAILRDMPVEERAGVVSSVCDRLAEPVIDYVRLQIEATRAPL
jgi:trans-aconitate 2-methyltransferase